MLLPFKASRPQLKHLFLLTLLLTTVVSLLLYLWLSSDNSKERNSPQLSSPELQVHHQTLRKWTVDKIHGPEDGVKCVHPSLDFYAPAIMRYFKKQRPLNCSSVMKEWVYVTNGTFRISADAFRLHGNVTCEYSPIFRKSEYYIQYGTPVKPMLDGMPLQSDFFYVFCASSRGRNYTNYHASVAWNKNIMTRLQSYHSSSKSTDYSVKQNMSLITSPEPNDRSSHAQSFQNLSIFLLGFDSMSRMSWHRNLPQTREYFVKKLGAIELEKYNIMGSGTAAALLPMLTGQKKEELPEARRGHGGKPVDNYPWIWKEFSKRGYVTAFAQDNPGIEAFHYQMRGFEKQPTDHSMRPFYLAVRKKQLGNPKFCWGSKPRHMTFINWFGSLLDMYRDFPKFLFGHYLELSHGHTSRIQIADQYIVQFLKDLEEKGHLNSTLIIMLGDHGAKFSYMRKTAQGSLEERLPYFALRFPPWFQKLHPKIIQNVKTNSRRLNTPLDIHATFKDILNLSKTDQGDIYHRGISLFKEIPKERTCTHAGITPHWCACIVWESVDSSDSLVSQAVDTAIKAINNYTEPYRKKCAELTLLEVTKSVRYIPSAEDHSAEWKWLKFKNRDAPPPKLKDMYQVSFRTLPGEGHFEVTSEFNVQTRSFSVREEHISRTNKYGSQPACIQKSKPHLRPYCYCI